MSDYRLMSRRIKDAVIVMLQGIQYDTGSGPEPAFVNVLDNTKDDFEGYPSVRVLPNNLASVTGDNVDKDHTVAFAVLMHFPLEDPNNIESNIYNQMYDLTDLIVNTIEHSDYIGKLSQIDPSIQSWMMEMKSARWYVATGKVGGMLIVNVALEISYSKEVD